MYDGGTVCDDGFGDIEAKAICREMGYNGSSSWRSGLFYDIQNSLDILLDNVDCEDEDWSTCSYSTTHNCGHSEDVFLTCVQGEPLCHVFHSLQFHRLYKGFKMHLVLLVLIVFIVKRRLTMIRNYISQNFQLKIYIFFK